MSCEQKRQRSVPAWLWSYAGYLLGVFAAYALLAQLETNYFNQDDNFVQFVPVITAAAESLLRDGVFANWNPYQMLGAPVADVGVYALTYPLTYVCYLGAVWLFGDVAAFVEVWFLVHAALAGAFLLPFFYSLSRNRMVSTFAALAFVLSGYFLIAGRSWYYMIPVMTWLPAVFCLESRYGVWPRRVWIAALGAAAGIFFHAGNIQLWFYSMTCFGCWCLVRCLLAKGHERRRCLGDHAAAGIVAAAVALPLLYPQFRFASRLLRDGGGGEGVWRNLVSFLIPSPLASSPHPLGWGNVAATNARAGQLVYSGTVFTVAFLALSVIVASRLLQRRRAGFPWPVIFCLIAGWAAFDLCLGRPGGLWTLMAQLPVCNKFDHPFKWLPIFNFTAIAAGAAGLGGWSQRRPRLTMVLLAAAAGLLILHLRQADYSFYTYGDRSYPVLPEALRGELTESSGFVRVFAAEPSRSLEKGFTHGLTLNLATCYRIGSLNGYDPLVRETPEHQAFFDHVERLGRQALSEYGVSRITQFRDGQVTVTRLPPPRPAAWLATGTALPVTADFSGLRIANAGGDSGVSPITANWLWRPAFRAEVDGRGVPVRADALGRLQLTPAGPWQEIVIRYAPPWRQGLLLAAVAAVLAGAYLIWLPARASTGGEVRVATEPLPCNPEAVQLP